jgi:hypothetical protein
VTRVTVYHLTRPARLPLIEEEGLRTRADLSQRLGPPGPFDEAAPGRYAHGRRVSAYLDESHAEGKVAEHGAGFISFTVDPAKALGVPGKLRDGDPEAYWAAAEPLDRWLDDGPPDHLEVHQNVPVRAKHLRLHAPRFRPEDLGSYGPIVEAVADDDRIAAKGLMHLAIIASDAEFDSEEFRAAAALAWRDEPDPEDLVNEMVEIGVDRVCSAALAEVNAAAPDAAARLREVLDETREWAEQQAMEPGHAVFVRSAAVLGELGRSTH